ncbi:MAG: response regulator [Gammaproteobacteria bacterium]|nr:response regulator [Gammaproteobacteria bacterium]
MRRKFQHDALLILIICSWIPVAIAAALILVQMRSYRQIDEARVEGRLNQAKASLNSHLLGVEAAAEILLASRELNEFFFVTESIRPMTRNRLYARTSLLKKKASDISAFTVVNRASEALFSAPVSDIKKLPRVSPDHYGFSLIDQNTLRYYRPIEYDDQEFPGPAAKLRGFLILDIDLRSWRSSLGDTVKINKISKQPSIFGIDLEIVDNDAVSPGQYLPYLLVLLIVLAFTTMVGLHLTRSRIVKPITNLTDYVRQQMDTTPGSTQHHELAVLKESFETYIRYEKELQAKLLQQSTLAAIGRTTQMLAHDVRKPFSMLTTFLHLTRNAKDQADFNSLRRRLVPEIDKAVISVQGLIRDIMEVGSNRKPDKEIVHLSSLIQTTLYEAFRIKPRRDIKFRYALNHRQALYVDPIKASRVFSNITSNALEAMRSGGEIWFQTREMDNRSPRMMEITIGNSHSFVPKKKRDQIFDLFFTEGKQGGVGLGLAIVKKLVIDHDGEIKCESSEKRGTEFIFTLPMTDAISEDVTESLPSASDEIVSALEAMGHQSVELSKSNDNETRLAGRIIDIVRQLGRPVKVLIADDESLYQRVLESYIEELPLKPHVQLAFTQSAEKALEILGNECFDVVIMDVNFGKGKLNGFEAVKRLREQGNRATICTHSNHGVLEYQSRAIESGSNVFMLKPMSKAHLLDLIHSTVTEHASSRSSPELM